MEDPERLARLLRRPPGESLDALDSSACRAARRREADLMRALRRAKRESALLIALADIGGVWDVVAATEALTRFADAAVGAALAFLLRKHARRTAQARPSMRRSAKRLRRGRAGARQARRARAQLFERRRPDRALRSAAAAIPPGTEPGPLFVRMTKALARLLQERTSDGYVLRVDLRLRPDPGATPVALSRERLRLLRDARPELGARRADQGAAGRRRHRARQALPRRPIAPFIWRKYFDYAAIADIHAMKRQIHAVRGHERVVVPGHDIKLGRGGIREIEFFVQTQQLIFGGRRPQMRGARTLDMLERLHADKWVSAEAVDDLSAAYVFLRRLEHRLQMVADEQTQRLPFEPAALARFAKFCGYARLRFRARPDPSSDRASRSTMRAVRGCADARRRSGQSRLHRRRRRSRDAGDLARARLSAARKAAETDPRLAFRPPRRGPQPARARSADRADAGAARSLRRLGRSGRRARRLRRGARAHAGGGRAVVDPALQRAALRELFGDLLGSAPRLAQVVAARPHVLDAAIDPGRAAAIADELDEGGMAARVAAYLARNETYEDALDRARDFAAEEMFLIGVRLLVRRARPDAPGAPIARWRRADRRAAGRASRRVRAEHGRVRAAGSRCWRWASSARAR
jgi:glutamate-ammonia-ligase adenylyltransferase